MSVQEMTRREKVIALARGWAGPQGTAPKAAEKKSIDIEDMLRWAYREELPKARSEAVGPDMANASAPLANFLEELSLARSEPNNYGVFADFTAGAEPDDDALAVHQAVGSLNDYDLALPADWNPLEDCGNLGAAGAAAIARAVDAVTHVGRDGVRRLRSKPSVLILRHAILGGAPDWEIDRPEVKPVTTDNGMPKWFLRQTIMVDGPCGPVPQEIEVDGFDRRRRIPKRGAFQKFMLDPDPHLSILSRADYELWQACLVLLCEDLDGMLESHKLLPMTRAPRPWMTGDTFKTRRILTDLSSEACKIENRRPLRRVKRPCSATFA